jgi:hypothetical protein
MQAISLITSGLMLGIKVAKITALPTVWKKLGKWRAVVQPLREMADLGTELRHDPDQPELTEEEYMEGLERLQEALASWAAKPVPARLKASTKIRIQAHLEKTAQVFAVLINEANAPNAQPDALPLTSHQVVHSLLNRTRCTSRHTVLLTKRKRLLARRTTLTTAHHIQDRPRQTSKTGCSYASADFRLSFVLSLAGRRARHQVCHSCAAYSRAAFEYLQLAGSAQASFLGQTCRGPPDAPRTPRAFANASCVASYGRGRHAKCNAGRSTALTVRV